MKFGERCKGLEDKERRSAEKGFKQALHHHMDKLFKESEEDFSKLAGKKDTDGIW